MKNYHHQQYVFQAATILLYRVVTFEMNNQSFTPEEDQIIRDLYENKKIKQWGMIARALTEDYGKTRNARQCRDRYQKHLDPLMAAEWSVEEEKYLYKLHDQIGNKWAIIAQNFPGKTDNCVKNHFYSKLRKALRHLNKVIKQNFRKQFKEMKIAVLYKIIEALEDRFKETTVIDEEIVEKCLRLKYSLLEYAQLPDEEIGTNLGQEHDLIKEIVEFGKGYRRKTRRERRNSNQGNDLVKFPNYEKRVKPASDYEDSSEYSQVFSHADESSSENKSKKSEGQPLVIIEQDIRESMNSKYSYYPMTEKKIQPKYSEEMILRGSGMSIQSGNSVEQILKGKNAIEIFHPERIERPAHSQYSSNRSESQKADMFGDDLRFSGGMKQLMQIEQQQGGEQYNIFRSHK